jgi:AraC family ethanolamine operon transcriptional activator
MDFASLSSTSVLSTVRCSDPAEVAGLLPGANRRLLPLAGDFEFAQASLELGSLRIVLVRRPPCTSEGALDPRQIGIAWAMQASNGLKLNGIELDRPALMSHGFESPHRIAQPDHLTIGAVFLPAAIEDHCWPERSKSASVEFIRPDALHNLQSTLSGIVRLAARDPSRFAREGVVAGMQQSLLGGIDHAFATAPGAEPTSLAIGNYLRVCRRAGEFIRSQNGGVPTNVEVATAAGATVRTLHNAMIAVHGMSLQKLMVLNRLWAVRGALLHAGPDDLVKTIAFDHGFWHLGRFSQTYRAFFGEAPSDTLLGATGGRIGQKRQERALRLLH